MKLYSRKRKSPIKILVIITLLAGFAFAVSKQFVSKKINDIVVAQIGDENIYKSEIEKKLKEVFANSQSNSQLSFEKLPDQVLELFAKEIFLDRKIVAEAKRLGIDNSSEIKESIENFKTSTIRQAYINNSLKDVVTDQRIVEKFNEMKAEAENKNEYKYYQIVLKEQFQAESIYKELKSPKKPLKFSEAARKYSSDIQSSGNGGEVDYRQESSIQKTILDTLKNLKKDEISKPFQSGSDWYIVKFFDIKKSKPIEFESAKEYIRHLLKIEGVEKINDKFVKDNKVKILLKREVSDDNKQPLEESKSLDNPAEQNKNLEQDQNEETVQQQAPESTPEQEVAKEPELQPVESNQQKL
jgi:parvulin-like peptidyl-prolyl isomerase